MASASRFASQLEPQVLSGRSARAAAAAVATAGFSPIATGAGPIGADVSAEQQPPVPSGSVFGPAASRLSTFPVRRPLLVRARVR